MAWRHLTDAHGTRFAPRRLAGRLRPAVLRRDPVDPLDRRPVEANYPPIWQPQYLLATTAAVRSQPGAPCVVAGITDPAQ